MPLKSIIFDLDGTLLDTLQDLTNSVNHALMRHDMMPRPASEIRRYLGNGVRRLMASAVPRGEDNPAFEAAFTDFKAYYVRHCLDLTRPYDGIPELLTELHDRGYKLAIVSNKLQAGVTELHQRFFANTIDVAIGEREGIRRKPAPDMVIEAMRQLDVSPAEAVYVGDSEVDLATAAAAGLQAIAVLWGFRDRQQLIDNGAQRIATTPHDIIHLL